MPGFMRRSPGRFVRWFQARPHRNAAHRRGKGLLARALQHEMDPLDARPFSSRSWHQARLIVKKIRKMTRGNMVTASLSCESRSSALPNFAVPTLQACTSHGTRLSGSSRSRIRARPGQHWEPGR